MISKIKYFTLLVLVSFPTSCKTDQMDLPPPNIVWIVSEDNSMHYLKMFNENGISTPNIESLADEGLVYTRAFSNAPVCSVARSTLISGCFAPRLGSHYHRKIVKVPMPINLEMFPAYLRKAGYYTTNNKKEDYNFERTDHVWDESSDTASWKNRAKDQPFFHVFNSGITHEASLHFNDNIFNNKQTNTDVNTVAIQPNHPQTPLFKYTNALYKDKILEMDTKMGTIISQLKADGLYDNTFIFYYGDHGGVLPGSKGYLYETGLHVPLVVHVPKKYKHLVPNKLGSKVSAFVSFVDFGATVLNLAGVQVPEKMDGKPFLGEHVTENDLNSRDETFSYADRFDEKYDMVRALRKGKYKYIRNYEPFNYDGLMNDYRYKQLAYQEWKKLYNDGELNAIQSRFFEPKPAEMLFDVENDPYETNNLANNHELNKVLVQLRGRLNEYLINQPDLSFYPEHYLIKNAFDNPEEFGQNHKNDILKLIHIADLELSNYDDVKAEIETYLNSENTWERYWALIVCAVFGDQAQELAPKIKALAKSDVEPINKIRALEFIGLVLNENPLNEMAEILYNSDEVAECLLILNTMVLLTDNKFGYTAEYNFEQLPDQIKKNKDVENRLNYLSKKQ
jgi:arylsulfatase A-like enzyme